MKNCPHCHKPLNTKVSIKKPKLGDVIRRLREDKGYTLKDLADITGIQIATLSRIENNKMSGTVENLMLIGKALRLKMSELFVEIEKGIVGN